MGGASLRTLAGLFGVLVLLCAPASAAADTYQVTRTGDFGPGPCLPTDCSLREALEASNASTSVDDLILLPSATPYVVEGESLVITDAVEVRGDGADQVTVEGDELHVVFTNESPGVVLSGLTIMHGSGGIQSNAELTLRRVAVEHNQRLGGAGGIQSSAPLTIDSSFVGYNESSVSGGVFSSAPVNVVNSTIAWNSGSGTGAIGGSGSVSISSSAVLFNYAGGETAAGVTGAPLIVRDSIFAGNNNEKGLRNCSSSTPVKSLGGNVEDGATCADTAGDRPNVNPGADNLGRYGGTTLVYDLAPGSPAVDFAGQCPPLDQRGVARPQGAACDSGPYELVPSPPPPAPFVDRKFFMRVGKKLRLRKSAIWARLTCPRSEVSPPCQGWAVVPDPPLVSHGAHTLQARSFKGNFTISPGRTKWVPLKGPRGAGKNLPREKGKWKVSLLIRAEDGAGNSWKYVKKRRVPLVRR